MKMKKLPKKTNEALSPDEIISMSKGRIEAGKKDREEQEAKKRQQTIKSIWVKELHIDPSKPSKDYADLEITRMDGTVEQCQYPIDTCGVPGKSKGVIDDFSDNRNGGNDRFVSGDAYKSGLDPIYKTILADLKRSKAFRAYNIQPTDKDVRLSLIRVEFNDWRIQWFYGKDKIADSMWAFGRAMPTVVKNPIVRREAAKKQSAYRGRAVYTSGNTKIYKLDI